MDELPPTPATKGFHIVALGASAGGLDAFMELFHALPLKTGLAFIVIQHLEPRVESQLVDILSRATVIPVVQAHHGKIVEPDHVYVIPPNTTMTIENGVLQLAPRASGNTPHSPINRFFESLAADQGAHAVGVVLSGTGSDGAQGIRAIKGRYGITFAQDEQSAKYAGMPHSAAVTGAVDFVCPPSAIAQELVRIRTNPYLMEPTEALDGQIVAGETDGELQQIIQRLKQATKIDFGAYKQTTLRRRLGRRLAVTHAHSLTEYLRYLDEYPSEVQELYRDILISVTSFFREPEMFSVLTNAIKEYLASSPNEDSFRMWIPGCATGEEAYSLAMIASETLQAAGKNCTLQVFGTDVSDYAIERARSGLYSENEVAGISPERLHRAFSAVDSTYRIKQEIRDRCVFARHDLTSDPPFSQMDLVSCRNVFIYLSTGLQQRILPGLHYSLRPGGLLVLGSAETVGPRSDLFGMVDKDTKIFFKKQTSTPTSLEHRPSEAQSFSAGGASASKRSLQLPALLDLEARAARILRDLYAPAGVLIDDEMRILHFHGRTDAYLQREAATESANLLQLVKDPLVHPLRKAVQAAFAQRQPVHESGISFGGLNSVKLSVIPLTNEGLFFLVLFEEETQYQARLANGPDPKREPTAVERHLADVQRELAQTRDYLRKIVEDHEATTEELRASNEEARSTNEELQSTNEELRTAKEQMQSSNEELTTVNDELKHRNEELNLTTNDLINLLNAATIPVLIVGMDQRLRRFTPEAERLLKLDRNDLGRLIGEVQQGFLDLASMTTETLKTLSPQVKRVQSIGNRWYDVFVRPYRTLDDRIEGAVITLIDVDDATRSWAQVERARRFAEGIVETVQHPLLVLDADLRILRATGSFYKTFLVREEDTIGKTIDDLGNGQWRVPELRRMLELALLRDTPFQDLEITHDFPQVGTRTMRLNARRIGAPDAPDSLLLAIDDVTERQEAAEIQYRRLFESAKDAVVVLDAPSGTVIDVNPFLLELGRYPRAELIGKAFRDLPLVLENEEMGRLVEDILQTRTIRYDSVPMRARDRRELVCELVANRYEVKSRQYIQINIRDVTDKRRIENDLRRSNLDLRQFAFAASHDLQEPLRTITSYLELFQREFGQGLEPLAHQYFQFIIGAADHMRQMVLDLLGYSEIARSDLNPVEMSVEAALSIAMQNLQLAIESSHARITFDHLPTVYMDESQLVRLLQSLIGNSIKYRGEQDPHIHLSVRDAGPEWVFSVRDNGSGVDMRFADHIFTVFKRLHGREIPGTGIGLAISKGIVERHGGRIWVESQPGQGSTFYFTVPRRTK